MIGDSHDIHIKVNTGTIIRFFLVATLLVAFYYISDVILVIIAAIVIASAIEPLVRRLKRFKIHRIIAVILIYLFVAIILTFILVFFLPMVIGDITSFLSNIPSSISLGDIWKPLGNIGFGSALQTNTIHTLSISEFVNSLQPFLAGTSAGAFTTASFIFGGFLSFILIVVLSFYLTAKEEGVDDFLRIITPVKQHDYIIDLWRRSQRKIGYWLQGQILLGIIIGVLTYLVLMIVGIPHALLLALLAGMLEIIPVFGPIIASVPAVLIAFSDGGIGKAVLLAGLFLIIHQFENHIFYPLVTKKIVGISPIIVILALVIGFKLAGILGAILAVPLSAAFMEYINDIEKDKKAEKAGRIGFV